MDVTELVTRKSATAARPVLGKLVPPFRFGIVEDDRNAHADLNLATAPQQGPVAPLSTARRHTVYRSAYPSLLNLRYLLRLQLKSIVSLLPCEPVSDLRTFCHQNRIELVHFRVDRYKDEVTFTPSSVTQILQFITDAANLPLLIHCIDGVHNTGMVVMCLRKLLNWDTSMQIAEFCRHMEKGSITSGERQFLDGYRGDIVIPERMPPWLWGGVKYTRHPWLNIRHAGAPKSRALQPEPQRAISPSGLDQAWLSANEMSRLASTNSNARWRSADGVGMPQHSRRVSAATSAAHAAVHARTAVQEPADGNRVRNPPEPEREPLKISRLVRSLDLDGLGSLKPKQTII